MLEIKRWTKVEEIHQLKALQDKNLKSKINQAEQKSEGFLTASYSVEFLIQMNQLHPAILAKDGEELVGYALVTTASIRGHHELLDDLIHHCDRVHYQGGPLAKVPYAIVGQLCVAKAYRGQGIVQKPYSHFKACMEQDFYCCITDVDRNNPRSLKAHLKSGFEVVGSLEYDGAEWDLVLWDWKA